MKILHLYKSLLKVRKFIKAKIIVQDSLSDNYQMVTGHVRTEEVLKFNILKASYLLNLYKKYSSIIETNMFTSLVQSF